MNDARKQRAWWHPSRLIEGALALRQKGWAWVLQFLGKTLRRIGQLKVPRFRRIYLGVEEVEPRVMLSTYYWDGGGNDSNWANAQNWSSDIVPGASDTAVIDNGGTVSLD